MKKDAFNSGVLCLVIRRKYRGRGKPVLILHEAEAPKGFMYGAGDTRHWTVKDFSLKARTRAVRKQNKPQ